MIALIDNYDSFTYNVVQYLSELGAEISVFRNDELSAEAVLDLSPRAVVLSPGPGRPEHAGMINQLVELAAGTVPLLGICLGHQSIAQVFGGRIGYAPAIMHGKTSDIHHDGSALFRNIDDPFIATRYHSLVIERETLPNEFIVSAWTDDEVIMAIRHREHILLGVQFHPESIMTPDGKTILENFLELL